MIGLPGYSRYVQSEYMHDKFDRHTFNPNKWVNHKATLFRLRQQGSSRSHCYYWATGSEYKNSDRVGLHQSNHINCCGSTALRELTKLATFDIISPVMSRYLDIGAGDSPDILIASALGYHAYSLDLFQPFRYGWVCNQLIERKEKFFVQADGMNLPFANNSFEFITSQAMITLLPPSDRLAFYREVLRVLEKGGVFCLTGATLRCGHGKFSQADEHDRALMLTPHWDVVSSNCGFLTIKR